MESPVSPSVVAGLGYLKPMRGRPYHYAYEPPQGVEWQNCELDLRDMDIADARAASRQPSLAAEGFVLLESRSTVTDFLDEQAVTEVYYRELAEIALAATGAGRAYVFDHMVRMRESGRPALGFGRRAGGRPAANGWVHNDYTEESGRRRLALVLGDAAAVRRFCIVNLWRSIGGPVLDTPLAVCDATTVRAADLVTGDVRYPKRTGEIHFVTHSPAHRWSYFSAMDRDEVLVFKQYDSQPDAARCTPHAAFDHPDPPPGAPLRKSIEARCLLVYE
jgi:hypothetical protein